jgi:SH3 domain protein
MIYKKLVTALIWFSCSFLGFQVLAQEPNDSEGEIRYISDDLFTYLHAGPGRNFRILGSVVSGTSVTLLQVDVDNNFVEVIDDRQRTGWIDAEYVSTDPSLRELVPGLQQQLQLAEQKIEQQDIDEDLLNQQIADLTSQIVTLKNRLSTAEKENKKISNTLANYDQTAEMEWFTRGGIVAVISLLLGIIITYLPKKRRRNDNWM